MGRREEEQGKRNERAALKKEGRETTEGGMRRDEEREEETERSTACHHGGMEKKWKTDIGKRENLFSSYLSLLLPPSPFLLASSSDAFHGRIEDMFTLLKGRRISAYDYEISIFKCKKELK